VANAVFDAVGARIRTLPILPEKVWRELNHKPAPTSRELFFIRNGEGTQK
jgi:hypothetical protein